MTMTPTSTAPAEGREVWKTGAVSMLAPRTRPPIAAVDATVIDNRPLRDRYWRLRLAAPALAAADPGQFAMLTVTRDLSHGPVLPRPMAIYDTDAASAHADIVYSVVGEGTRSLPASALDSRSVSWARSAVGSTCQAPDACCCWAAASAPAR